MQVFGFSTNKRKILHYEKKMYRKILKNLDEFLGTNLKGHKKRRKEKLAGLICGLMNRKKPSLSALGSGLPQMIKSHSREKSAKKFLENRFIDMEGYYQPFISRTLRQIVSNPNIGKGIKLVIDGSKMGKDHMVLMVSLLFEGRGFPLLWLVRKKPKGHFKSELHVELMKNVLAFIRPIIPKDKTVTLLGDGEFDSIALQQFCIENSWDYVFRTACDTVFYENGSRFQPKQIESDDEQKFISIPDVEFTEKRMGGVHFVLWHDPKYDAPLPLISNKSEPIDIIEDYDKRYSVECLFKDMKSTTFNIHKTRLKDSHAVSNLVMLAAFGIVLLIKIGVKYAESKYREYIHRIRDDRKVNSIISYARDFISFCFEENLTFCFSFQFSKNSS